MRHAHCKQLTKSRTRHGGVYEFARRVFADGQGCDQANPSEHLALLLGGGLYIDLQDVGKIGNRCARVIHGEIVKCNQPASLSRCSAAFTRSSGGTDSRTSTTVWGEGNSVM